jgi:sugar phosphate permease
MINSRFGLNGWRVGWFVLALLIILVAAAAALLMRDNPQDVGLLAAGHAAKDSRPHDGSRQPSSGGRPGTSG